MGDGSTVSQPIVSATEPRRWIAAIVGGVVLGEALWSMLQILVRDWAAPALTNAMGQGPTKNPGAFDPLPLVIAFVEACAAAIILVLLMAWAQRRVRVVVRTVTAPVAAQVAVPPAATTPVARTVQASEPRVALTPVVPSAPAAPVMAAQVPTPRPIPPVVTQPAVVQPTPVAAAPAVSAPTPVAPVAAPVPAVQAPAKAAPIAPKKPKVIYYNSVGEPIEE
jgi:hypothetical protein